MTIPGDAPALAEVHITHSGGAAAPVWALISWLEKPQLENRVWNGDFDRGTGQPNGWSIAVVTNITEGATSITRITTASKYPPGSGEVVVGALANRGVSFRIFRKFKRGVTYTAEAWIQSAAETTATYIRLGNANVPDLATSGNTNLSTAWQRITVAWTPTADRDDAHIAVNIGAATATTFRIDGVMVYEGTTAPTSENQSFGRGGYPPVGILEAETTYGITGVVANGNYRSGFGLRVTASAITSLSTKIHIDPALLVPADHQKSEVAIEAWARLEVDAAKPMTAILSAFSLGETIQRYTLEHGPVGKSVIAPSSGTAFRFVRLGTLILPTDLGRLILHLQLSLSADSGTAGIDYLVLVPANKRALSPSGKANDANYPDFLPDTTENTKRILSDLTATFAAVTLGTEEHGSHGLGGSFIELPANGVDVDWLVKLSNLVPDDPTSDTSTEQLAHSATVHFAATPRYHLARSS